MATKASKKTDRRELPSYTIIEAAHYLNIPDATVRYWATGQDSYAALIEVTASRPTLLSFINLVELHVLAAIRRRHTVPMPKVRAAIEYLKKNARSAHDKKHPLISRQLETDGLDLFIQWYGELISISRDGQLAMRDVMSAALHRIERDDKGIPVRLYPFTRSDIRQAPSMIVIDPTLSAGRPVIASTGLATEVIAERYKAGESIKELARDYERQQEEIEEAVRSELRAAA